MLDYVLKKYFYWRYTNLVIETEDFAKTQNCLLNTILERNKNAVYFAERGITDTESFRTNCPLVSYDDIESDILKIKAQKGNSLISDEIKAFSKSSGTTSQSKFIPFTQISLDFNFKAGKDMLALYLHSYPSSEIISGKNFSLTGSYTIENGFVVGDVSSLFAYFLSPWYKPFRSPELSIATMSDWENKLEKLCKILSKEDIRWIAGVPSWMKVVIDAIESYNQRPIREIWPNLEVYFYGGVSIEPFRSYFAEKFENLILWQTYNASEGFYGLQQNADETDVLLLPNNGSCYEFICRSQIRKVHPAIISSGDLKIGEHYELVITNFSGLYRYRTGDMIEVTGIKPFKIQVIGRTKSSINMFGEELMVHNTDEAIRYLNELMDDPITEYTAAPMIDQDGKGFHRWLIESEVDASAISDLERKLDEKLQLLNSDYKAKREKDFILKNLKLVLIPRNSFYQWLKQNNRLNIQSKIPKLWNSDKIQSEILSFVE
jgi:phenylacetate-coenzyme A ligase PaaK-like adenylate-forming protein